MKKELKGFEFGYDLENTEKVQNYLEENYIESFDDGESGDFVLWIEMGGEIMNYVEIHNEKILKDKIFLELVDKCDKCDEEGNFPCGEEFM